MAIHDRLIPHPSPEKFAYLVIEAMKQAGREGPFTVLAERFAIQVGSGHSTVMMNLNNVYQEYLAAPEAERRRVLDRFVAGYTTPDAIDRPFEQVRHKLRPRVRERFWYEAVRLECELHKDPPPDIPFLELAPHLAVEVAVDLPAAIASVSHGQFTRWGVPFDEALRVARNNLQNVSGDAFQKLGPGIYRSSRGDNWDASRLYLPELIRRLDVRGRPVAAVPNRDTLIVTGTEDAAGLTKLAELTEQVLDEHPRPMTGMPVVLEGDQWRSFLPEKDHPHYRQFRLLYLRSVAGEYEGQGRLLTAIRDHQEQSEYTYVGSMEVAEEEGVVFSSWVWVEGVTTLAPKAERIGFVRMTEDWEPLEVLGIAEWDDVMAVVGDRFQSMDHYPPRYRVEAGAFPNEVELRKIGLA